MQEHTPHHQCVNLAWFVGTGQTRFLQVRIVHLKALALFAVVLLLWTVLSLYLIFSLVSASAQMQVTLQSSLATLLDYQSRYDNVYETAYQTTPSLSPSPAPAVVATTQPVPQPLNVRKVLPDPQLLDRDHKNWPLHVKQPLFTATGEEFVLQVQLRNTHKGKTTRGQVKAHAKLVRSDGTELLLSSTSQGSGKYRIKKRKTQTFGFVLPPASAGRIKHISIKMSNNANQQATWLLPIDVPYVTAPSRLTFSERTSP